MASLTEKIAAAGGAVGSAIGTISQAIGLGDPSNRGGNINAGLLTLGGPSLNPFFSLDTKMFSAATGGIPDSEEFRGQAESLFDLPPGTLTDENLPQILGTLQQLYPQEFSTLMQVTTGASENEVRAWVNRTAADLALDILGVDSMPTYGTDAFTDFYEEYGAILRGETTERSQTYIEEKKIEVAAGIFEELGYEPSPEQLREAALADNYPTAESIGAYVDPLQVTTDEVIERLERLGVDVEAQAEAAGQTPEEYAEQIKESIPPGDGSEAAFDESMVMSLTSTAAASGGFKESITKLATGVRNLLFGTGPGGRPKTWQEILKEQIEKKYFPTFEDQLPGFPLEIIFEPGGASASNPTGALVRANVKIPVPFPVNGPPIVIPLFNENGTYIGPSTPSGLLVDPETGIITQVVEGVEQTVAQIKGEAVQILGAAGDVVRSFPLWMLENPDWKEGDPNPFEIEVDENGDITPQVDENGNAATGFDPETGLPVYEQPNEDEETPKTAWEQEGDDALGSMGGPAGSASITAEDLEAQKEAILSTISEELNALGIAVEDVEAILGGIETTLEDVATTDDLDVLRTNINEDLEESLGALGLDIEEVNDIVESVATDLDTLSGDVAAVGEAVETVSGQVADLDTELNDRIDALVAAGEDRATAVDTALGDLATEIGTTKDDILEQLGTTEANLSTEIQAVGEAVETVSGQVADLDTELNDRIDALVDQGATEYEALSGAISSLASDLNTSEENILSAIATSDSDIKALIGTPAIEDDPTTEEDESAPATGLYAEFGPLATKTDVEAVGTSVAELSELVTFYANQGFENDEALSLAISDLSDRLGTTEENLLTSLGETEETILGAVEGVSAQIDETNVNIANLNELVTFYANQGFENDEALSLAISDLSDRLGTTEENLLTSLGETEETILGVVEGVSAQIDETNVNIANLNELIVQYELDGKTRDEALSLALSDLSTDLGITKEEILTNLGETEETILTRIAESEDNTEEYLTYISNIIGIPASEITQEDVDGIVGLLGEEEAITEINNDIRLYDANFDGVINDIDIGLLQGLVDAGIEGVGEIPATGLYADAAQRQLELQGYIDDSAQITQGLISSEAADTRQLVGQTALVNALASAGDLSGTRVDVSTPDPARINYIYDFADIFATPQQKGLFPSPYGGPQRAQQQQIAQKRSIMSGPLQIGGMAQGGKVDYDFTDEIMQIMSYGDN